MLAYSPAQTPFFFPALGATVYPSSPLSFEAFIADAQGNSPRLADMSAVSASLDGLFASWQSAVFDPAALGGIAVTKGGRLALGIASSSQTITLRSFPATSGVPAATAIGGD